MPGTKRRRVRVTKGTGSRSTDRGPPVAVSVPALSGPVSAMILQGLYDSEIDVSVESLYDLGFTVKIGDKLNGFMAEQQCLTWAEAEEWLRATALTLFPESAFARRYPN
jgi:hypothetical protein